MVVKFKTEYLLHCRPHFIYEYHEGFNQVNYLKLILTLFIALPPDGLPEQRSLSSLRGPSPSLPDIRSRPSVTFCPNEPGTSRKCPEKAPAPPTVKRRSVYIDYDENDPIATLERSFEACLPYSGNVSASQTIFVEHKCVQTQYPQCKKDASTQYEEDACLRGKQGVPKFANVKKEKTSDGSSCNYSYTFEKPDKTKREIKQAAQSDKTRTKESSREGHPNKHMLFDFNHPGTSKQVVSKILPLPNKGVVDEPTTQQNISELEKMTKSLNDRINQLNILLESLNKKDYNVKKLADTIQSSRQNSQIFREPQFLNENQPTHIPTTKATVRFDDMTQLTEKNSMSSLQSLQVPLSRESINNDADYADTSEPVLNDIIPAVISITNNRDLRDILLMITLHGNIYHISIQERSSHKVLGCILASQKAIKDATRVGFFTKVLTFSAVDMRNSINPLKQLFGLPFGFVSKKTQYMMETTLQRNEDDNDNESPGHSKEKPSGNEECSMTDDEDTRTDDKDDQDRSDDEPTRKYGVHEFITKVLNYPLDKALQRRLCE